jgi:hypothetical protein
MREGNAPDVHNQGVKKESVEECFLGPEVRKCLQHGIKGNEVEAHAHLDVADYGAEEKVKAREGEGDCGDEGNIRSLHVDKPPVQERLDGHVLHC